MITVSELKKLVKNQNTDLPKKAQKIAKKALICYSEQIKRAALNGESYAKICYPIPKAIHGGLSDYANKDYYIFEDLSLSHKEKFLELLRKELKNSGYKLSRHIEIKHTVAGYYRNPVFNIEAHVYW